MGHLVSEIENIERRLEAVKLELLKLKALQMEAEEIDMGKQRKC